MMLGTSPMMSFHIPDDPEVLRAIGEVSIVHSSLDFILAMTIKTLAGIEVRQALDATAFQGSRILRSRINKLAAVKLGEGSALLKLQALLERCRRATDRRNELIHNVWASNHEGVPLIRTREHTWEKPPTAEDLDGLASELAVLVGELNEARLEGFLAQALSSRHPTDVADEPS